ncbi:hypothetical protein KA047_01370 [Candidatus Saccharibacteria bacterium]|nr:hypothetical protein [Candidatus Saccharibacteria bacterium]
MPEQLPGYNGANALVKTIEQIVAFCIDDELITRQRNLALYQPEYAPIEEGVKITLETVANSDGIMQNTRVGNVHHIRYKSVIAAGAILGNHCIIGARVSLQEFCEIDDYARMDHSSTGCQESRVERGGTVLVNSRLGAGSIVGEQAELGYDIDLPPESKVLPGGIITTIDQHL